MDDHITILLAAVSGCATALASKLPAWVDKWVLAQLGRERIKGPKRPVRRQLNRALRVGIPKKVGAARLAALRRSCQAERCHVAIAGLIGRPRAFCPDVSCVALVRGGLLTRVFACDISFGPSKYDDFGSWDRLVAHVTSRAEQINRAANELQRSCE